jgi:DtxR family transcriptional regulator, Mn-dependent transcriptional regulator
MSALLLVVAGILLLAGGCLLKKRGFAWRPGDRKLRRHRMLLEDTLKRLHDIEYAGESATANQIAQGLGLRLDEAEALLAELGSRELVQSGFDTVSLSPRGRQYAVHLVRAHRLWEAYLAEKTGLDETEWHRRADKLEHQLSPPQLDLLAARIGNPTHDPHGDPIPTAEGQLPAPQGQPLSTGKRGDWVRVIHLEDEPVETYAQIRAQGLHPGMDLRLTEVSKGAVRFESEGREYRLPASAAWGVTVVPQDNPTPAFSQLLSDLETGEEAVIVAISKGCRSPERRRLMDLGILPGTRIRAELRSPTGDPVAYRVRGTLIGLRSEQARHIGVNPCRETSG